LSQASWTPSASWRSVPVLGVEGLALSRSSWAYSHCLDASRTATQFGEIPYCIRRGYRLCYDFLDTLVALRFLERDAMAAKVDGRYLIPPRPQRPESAQPALISADIGMFSMHCCIAFWNDLTEALRTGKPQKKISGPGSRCSTAVPRPARWEEFHHHARDGRSSVGTSPRCPELDFSNTVVCDVGGANVRLLVSSLPPPSSAVHELRSTRRRIDAERRVAAAVCGPNQCLPVIASRPFPRVRTDHVG